MAYLVLDIERQLQQKPETICCISRSAPHATTDRGSSGLIARCQQGMSNMYEPVYTCQAGARVIGRLVAGGEGLFLEQASIRCAFSDLCNTPNSWSIARVRPLHGFQRNTTQLV